MDIHLYAINQPFNSLGYPLEKIDICSNGSWSPVSRYSWVVTLQSFYWILKLFFQQVFPKMMFWPFKDVCKHQTLWHQKIWCLPSEYMLSARSKRASFSSLAKKRKSCAFLIQSFWFTVFLFFHFGVKHCFHDTGLKLKALCISFALKKLDTALLVSDQWCIVNLFQGDQNPCKVMGSLNSMYGELSKKIISKIQVTRTCKRFN